MIASSAARPWRVLAPTARVVAVPSGPQSAAAEPATGVTVVLGGPGTGKSLVAAESVARRLRSGQSLDRLVVLAASRAAAQGLRREIARRVGGAQVAPRVTTTHGFALGLLRQLAGPDEAFRLLRAPEQDQRLRDALAGLGADFWPEEMRAASGTRAFARQVRDVLARARHLTLDPEDLEAMASASGDAAMAALGRFFEHYLTLCDWDGSFDYAELIHRARLVLAEPAAGRSVAATIDAVVVDDVHEFDAAQVGLLTQLHALGIPSLALGDPAQRITSFRGATAHAIPLLVDLPGARTLELVEGWRCREAVADAVNRLSARVAGRAFAPPVSPALGLPGRVSVSIHDDPATELAHVADALRRSATTDGLAWADLAVVVRAGRSQLAPVARELARRGIPVDVVGDELPLADQPAVQTLLLALTVAGSGVADPDQTQRLLASPLAELDSVALRTLGRRLVAAHPGEGTSTQLINRALTEPAILADDDAPAAVTLRRLGLALGTATTRLAAGGTVPEVLWHLWTATDWPERLRTAALGGSRSADHHLDAVVELFDLASRRDTLSGPGGARTFINEVRDLEIPADTGRELDVSGRGVRVLTAHRAHGEEWERVWVVGVQEGLWPRTTRAASMLDPDRLAPDHLDAVTVPSVLADERRLFLVACSRARGELHVSASQGIEGEGGRPSRFLSELGIEPARVLGLPNSRLSAPALVAELRATAGDQEAAPGLRRAAALRLARLAGIVDGDDSRPFRAADPSTWWWLRDPSSGARTSSGPLVLDGSSLGALLDCPRNWFLSKRAQGVAGRRSKASVGDVVHLIAARAEDADLDRAGAQSILDDVWDRIAFETEWMSASERVEIEAALDRFFEWRSHSSHEVLGTEIRFSTDVEVDGHQIVLRGTVDRLELDDGRLKVIDIKTGRSTVSKTDAPGHEQLGVYQLAASLGAFDAVAPSVHDVAPPELLFLRHGDLEPEVVSQPTLAQAPTLAGTDLVVGPTWLHDKLADAARTVSSGRFEARTCGRCRFCPFRDSCPAVHPELGGEQA